MWTEFKTIIRSFGPLRIALIMLVLLDMLFRPLPGAQANYEGIGLISHLLAPVLSPILFMLILLDIMMAMIYRSDKVAEVRTRYLIIVLFELLLALLFFLYWLPFFRAMNI